MKKLLCICACFFLLISVIRALNDVPPISVSGLLEYCSTFEFGERSFTDYFADIATDFESFRLWEWSDDLNLFKNLGSWFSSFGTFLVGVSSSILSIGTVLTGAVVSVLKFLLYLLGFEIHIGGY